MKRLTPKEEEIMQILWDFEKAFVRDIVDAFPAPRPHYNTVSTIIRILEDKGIVSHERVGGGHRYYPLLSKESYKKESLKKVLVDYFDNSYKGLVSYFAEEEKLTEKDLREIISMIKKKEK